MGEIIFSIVTGGCLVAAGVFINCWLTREEKKVKNNEVKEASEV